MKKSIIALYITKNGRNIALKLKRKYGDKLSMKKIGTKELIGAFKYAFEYRNIIAIMATGIVVRAISSLIEDKKKDPAIVVVDELGKYVISLLSGHLGGANELAMEIANTLGATPVITTSSDVQGYKALDLYAKEKGYIISDAGLYRKVARLMTERKKIPVFIENGEENTYFSSTFFRKYKNIENFLARKDIKLAVSWRDFGKNDILYLIPRKLVAGIGFHRGMEGQELFDFIKKVCVDENIHIEAIKKIVTLDRRREEEGLIELARRLNCELSFYTSDELKNISHLVKANKKVEKYHGIGNVSEACAILGSNFGKIIVPKRKGGVITLCIALASYM